MMLLLLLLFAAPTATPDYFFSPAETPRATAARVALARSFATCFFAFFYPYVDGEGHIHSVEVVPREQVYHGLAVDMHEVPCRTVLSSIR